MAIHKYFQADENGKVTTAFCVDEKNIVNELRRVLNDIATTFGQTKFGDGLYPKDDTQGLEFDINRVTVKSEAGDLTIAECGVIKLSASGAYTLNLPTAVGNKGKYFLFLKTDDNSNLITLDAFGSETIGGQLTYIELDYQWAYILIKSDGANWQIFGRSRKIVHIVHYQDVRASDDDYIHTPIIGTGVEQEITTGIINPDIFRNASILTTNVASPSGIVKLEGINNLGKSDQEEITIIAGGIAYGNVAWATLSKIIIPAGVSSSDSVAVGISDKLGLISEIDNVADVFKKKIGSEDRSLEIFGKVSKDYNTLDCETIIDYENITIWYKGRV